MAKLPRNAEARSARIDLLYNLGYLYWAMGDAGKALQQLKAGLDLAPEPRAGPIRSSLLNGLAIISYEAKQYEQAVNLYREAMQESPQDALLTINLSATCCALGRNQEAIELGKRAAKLHERDARVWNTLGHIYAAVGRYDDAISCFSKAAELGPRIAAYPSALAICYDLVERQDETHRQLEIARRLARDSAIIYVDIYETALYGNSAKSLELARQAIGARTLSAIDLRRDPNLSLLLDSVQIEQMTV